MLPPDPNDLKSKIVHVDMDCFFAAVELRDRPDLKSLPVAVGGSGPRSVLSTCNYVARRFGCHSAMPSLHAKQRCPQLIILPPNFEKYREESQKIFSIFKDYSDHIERLSLDEAFIDLSTIKTRTAWSVAKEIRKRIFETTGLTASAGISNSKLVAKIASDWKKPNGQFAVLPQEVKSFMAALPIQKLWGVGPKTAEKLEKIKIKTCADIQNLKDTSVLDEHFGRFSQQLFEMAFGYDTRTVQSQRVRKSCSTERTFSQDLEQLSTCRIVLAQLNDELLEELSQKYSHRQIREVFVKFKFSDFQTATAQCQSRSLSLSVAQQLVEKLYHSRPQPKIRLIGLGVRFSDLASRDDTDQEAQRPYQLELFNTPRLAS